MTDVRHPMRRTPADVSHVRRGGPGLVVGHASRGPCLVPIVLAVSCLAACVDERSVGTSARASAVSTAAPDAGTPTGQSVALPLSHAITLPGVRGRIDHLAVDLARRRLFVAALGNDTVEVLDLDTRTTAKTLHGIDEPQGVVFLPERDELWVSSGGSGRCHVFSGEALDELSGVPLGGDADNVRALPGSARVVVGCGDGSLAVIDAARREVLGRCALPAHPESFQLEREGTRAFVNVPGAGRIVVVDREAFTVLASWAPGEGRANYPMALDEGHGRLFVGLRSPASLVVLDTSTGEVVQTLACVGDVDDLFLDDAGHLFAVGGEGFVDVFERADDGAFARQSHVGTSRGARTGLWVPEWGRLFVAAPRDGEDDARVLVFEVS